MAHNVKYRCTHKTKTSDNESIHVIEILQDGFSGTVTDVKGGGDIFRHEYEKIDPTKPLENPIQKGRLEFFLQVRGQGTDSELGYDGQAILDEIFASDEQEYILRKKLNGNVKWSGYILNDMLEYPEGEYTYTGKIVAKDLTRLSGVDFPLTDDRVTIINTIADLLDDLNLGLDIYTYTSWVEDNVTQAQGNTDYDFLNQIYNERKALREFARTGDETDQPITNEEALEKVLANYGLILRQADNAWRLYQLTALENPTSVWEFQYDSTGTQTASGTTDLTQTIDKDSRFILPGGQNQINPAIRRVNNKFDHRAKVSQLQFPDNIDPQSSFSQTFISDGSQSIKMGVSAQGRLTSGTTSADAQISIKAGKYWWDGDNVHGGGWVEDTQSTPQEFFDIPLTISSEIGGIVFAFGSRQINTTDIPADGDGTIQIDFGTVDNDNGDSYYIASFTLDSAISSENSTSIDYELTQDVSIDYSTNLKYTDTWYGDGPFGSAPSALRYSTSDTDLTLDSWQRRGSTSYRNLHENLLKEILDVQRSPTRNLKGVLWGAFSPANVVDYNTDTFFFLGGTQTGKENRWDGYFLEISVETATTDTFDDIPKFTDETGSGTGTTSSGGSGGLDQSTADARYLMESNNLSDLDSASTARSNLNVLSSTEISNQYLEESNNLSDLDNATTALSNLNLPTGLTSLTNDEIDELSNIGGTNISSANWGHVAVLDQDLATTDSPTFAGGALNGNTIFDAPNTDSYIEIDDLTNGEFIRGFASGSSNQDWIIRSYTSNGFQADFNLGGINVSGDSLFTGDVDINGTDANGGTLDTDASVIVRSGNMHLRVFADATNEYIALESVLAGTSSDRDLRLQQSGGKVEIGGLLTAQGGIDVTGGNQVNIFASGNNENLFRLSDPSAPADAGYEIGFSNFDGDNTAISHYVEYNSSVKEVFQIDRQTEQTYWKNLLTAQGGIDVTNTATFNDNVESDLFSGTDWADNGYQGTDAGDWVVENLRVRNALEVYEFVAKQISSVGGKEILSVANGRIEEVEPNSKTNVISVQDVDGQDVTSLEEGDLWIVQEANINNDRASGGSGGIVRSAYGTVVNDSSTDGTLDGNEVELDFDQGTISDLEQNDLIVVYGSSDPDRNAIMYRNVDRSDDNLITRVQTGITAFSDLTDPANTSVAYGDLNGYLGISSEEFGFFAGDVSGNYVLATENQVDMNVNTFKLDANDLLIDSANNRAKFGDATTYLDWNSGTLDIVADSFDITIDSNNSISADGTGVDIKAQTFNLSTINLSIDSANETITLGSVFSADGGANIGTLASLNVDSSHIWTDDGSATAGTFTGLQPGTGVKQFFSGADDKNGTNASFYVQDGRVFYEAIRDVIRSPKNEAENSIGGAAAVQPNTQWKGVTVTSIDTNNSDVSTEKDILVEQYLMPFGINRLQLRGTFRFTEDFNNNNNDATIRMTFNGETAEQSFDTSSANQTITLDLTNITADDNDPSNFPVEQQLVVTLDVTAADITGDDNTVTMEIRNDYLLVGDNV